jgi:tetratricopeptide (TPR) repeat protein
MEAGRREAEAKRDDALAELDNVRDAEAQLGNLVLAQRAQVIAAQKASAQTVEQAIRSFHRDDFTAAVRAYQRALQVDPRNPYVLDLKSYAEYKAGKLDDAIESVRRSLTIAPTYVWDYFELMRYQCAAGDYDAALETLDDALAAATGGPIDPLFPKNSPSDLLTGPTGLKYFLNDANGGEGDGEFRRLCRPLLPKLMSRLQAADTR